METEKNEFAEYMHELFEKYGYFEPCENIEVFLRQRVERIYDVARHRPSPKERQSAICYLKLAARRFLTMARHVDCDIATMYTNSLEAIQREVDFEVV